VNSEQSVSAQVKDAIIALQAWPDAHRALAARLKSILANVELLEGEATVVPAVALTAATISQ